MGGDDHRCEWRERAEALEARLAQAEATLEKLQRHQFGARSEKMQPVAEAIRDPARAEVERIASQQKRRENAEKKRQLVTRNSLIATCEASGVNPLDYLADVLLRVQTHPAARIDELLPHN